MDVWEGRSRSGVPGLVFACPVQCDEFLEEARLHLEVGVLSLALHQRRICVCIGCVVGVDDVLVGASGYFKGDVLVAGEQVDGLRLVLLTLR